MRRVRALTALLILNGVLAVWLAALFRIQVASPRQWSRHGVDLVAASVAQRRQGVELADGRGDFTDRQGRKLTGFDEWALAVFPEAADRVAALPPDQRERFCRLLGTDEAGWRAFVQTADLPAYWTGGREDGKVGGRQAARLGEEAGLAIRELSVPGLQVVGIKRRYQTDIGARHWIGYVSEDPQRAVAAYGAGAVGAAGSSAGSSAGSVSSTSSARAGVYRIGGAGLERTFDRYVRTVYPPMLYRFVDGAGQPLDGMGLRLSTGTRVPFKVRTTMDLDIQTAAEAVMDRGHVSRGAAVVLDVHTSDVLAMVSRPDYSPYDLEPTQGRWRNLAVSAAIPGSIFKTVVAAAALEAGVAKPDERFECTGSLGRYGFRCWKPHGHGILTFREGFAQSCNIVFAEVMRRLPPGQLERTAARLGIGLPVGWSERELTQLDGEEAGQLYAAGTPAEDDGVRVQTAIGQRDVRMSPLQGAGLAATIARGGRALEARSALEVQYAGGRVFRSFAIHPMQPVAGKNGISPVVARTLRTWMRDVVLEGTGQALRSARWPLAGKSGTAQQTAGAGATAALEQHWFIGFAPADHPRYAVAVLVSDVPAGGKHRATPLFGQLMDALAELESARSR